MTSFRKIEDQAKSAIIKCTRHGSSRAQEDNLVRKFIRSLGTESKYKSCITVFLKWCRTNGFNTSHITADVGLLFLQQGANKWSQKTLDGYRQALNLVFGLELEYVLSGKPTILYPRAYRIEQILFLMQKASNDLSLSIAISAFAGLRALELDTICSSNELSEDDRDWIAQRFEGMDSGVSYVVTGKGGLRRKIFLSVVLSQEMELRRLEYPTKKTSRKIHYTKRYDLTGGQMFSQQFSRLSKSVFGWSTGAHGLRHTYAQSRLDYLQRQGYAWRDALEIVSQEMGHFSINNTLAYFR